MLCDKEVLKQQLECLSTRLFSSQDPVSTLFKVPYLPCRFFGVAQCTLLYKKGIYWRSLQVLYMYSTCTVLHCSLYKLFYTLLFQRLHSQYPGDVGCLVLYFLNVLR